MALSFCNDRLVRRSPSCCSSAPRRLTSRPARVTTHAAATETNTAGLVGMLKMAATTPGSVPPSEILKAMVSIEKSKVNLPDNWFSTLSAPGKRWRLVYTAAAKDVQAASKGSPAKGGYFPLVACQKFDADFDNGVFFGPLGSLTFKGPCITQGKQLSFDVHTMTIGMGPWRVAIPLKKGVKPLAEMDRKDVKDLPFFIYAYIDEEIVVARGRSGGLAMWTAADPEWQASAGVLQAFK